MHNNTNPSKIFSAKKTSITMLFAIFLLPIQQAQAKSCKTPKSYYKNVICTSNSRYFVALKDSGKPVALLNKSGKKAVDLFAYDKVLPSRFRSGLLPVQKNGKVGYINTRGNVVIPLVYQPMSKSSKNWARPVSNSRIIVKKNGQLGVISTYNRVIFPFSSRITRLDNFSKGKAKITRAGKTFWLDIDGQVISSKSSNKKKLTKTSNTKVKGNKKPTPKIIPRGPKASSEVSLTAEQVSILLKQNINTVNSTSTEYLSLDDTQNKTIDDNQSASSTTKDSEVIDSDITNSTEQKEALPEPVKNGDNKKQPEETVTAELNEDPLSSEIIKQVKNISVSDSDARTKNVSESPSNEVSDSLSNNPSNVSEPLAANEKGKVVSIKNSIFIPHKMSGKWGFVDENNVNMITYSFDQVAEFSENLAGVRIGNKWGFIDIAGDLLVDFSFPENAVIRKNQTYKGKPPFTFINGKAWVGNLHDKSKLCADTAGKMVNCN